MCFQDEEFVSALCMFTRHFGGEREYKVLVCGALFEGQEDIRPTSSFFECANCSSRTSSTSSGRPPDWTRLWRAANGLFHQRPKINNTHDPSSLHCLGGGLPKKCSFTSSVVYQPCTRLPSWCIWLIAHDLSKNQTPDKVEKMKKLLNFALHIGRVLRRAQICFTG